MTDSIDFGSKTITFRLIFSDRKSLAITITPDLDVIVKAPQDAPIERIKERVRKKAPWIIKQQSYFLSFHPRTPEKKYVSGETHLYLGRQYSLKVTEAKINSVHFRGRFFEVQAKKKSGAKSLLKQWYRERAKIKFAEIAEPCIQRFQKFNVKPEAIYIQEMPKRWGSCTPKGKIILNPELIKAPKPCIEYVIIHELCHLVHPNHTNAFIQLQEKIMPDWIKWKLKLETLLA
ncbi:MAG: M48 family metallopeptidase [Bacteroidales bacterium]|nr:M48 family metallopeptidase [Bacteroidales bacterium]